VDDTGPKNKAALTYTAGVAHHPESEELQDGRRRAPDQHGKGPQGAETDDKNAKAMNDPEMWDIINAPSMRQVIRDFGMNPAAVAEHTEGNPQVMANIQKLVHAGILELALKK